MNPRFLHPDSPRRAESGNLLFIVLLAIVLFGLLTAAIQSTSHPDGANIDREQLAIRATEVQRYASELERAVLYIMNNGKSENEIRFAHPGADAEYGDLNADTDKTDQVFAREGGGALYRAPPPDVNDGSAWEFYGGTHLPGVGSDKADLVAVLPHVSQQFCDKINALNGQTGAPEDDGTDTPSGNEPGECIGIGPLGRFDNGRQFYDDTNTVKETTFTQDPKLLTARTAMQACVVCERDSKNYFYHVLMAR